MVTMSRESMFSGTTIPGSSMFDGFSSQLYASLTFHAPAVYMWSLGRIKCP